MFKLAARLIKWAFKLARKHGPMFTAGLIFALLCFLGLNAAMEPVSKSEYCGTACHEMNVSYQTWELSPHGTNMYGFRVECIDCHLPPKDEYFTHMTAKAYAGGKDMYKHLFGPEYDRDAIKQKVIDHIPSATCTHCHDDLLAKPSGAPARIAHLAAVNHPDDPENRCVACHEHVGHERELKVFSP